MSNGEYLQAYLVIMETGVCAVAVVEGEDIKHGKGLAISDVQDVFDGQVFDIATYPVTPEMKPGVFALRKEGWLLEENDIGSMGQVQFP